MEQEEEAVEERSMMNARYIQVLEFSLHIVSLAMVFILLRWILPCRIILWQPFRVVRCFRHNFNMLKKKNFLSTFNFAQMHSMLTKKGSPANVNYLQQQPVSISSFS